MKLTDSISNKDLEAEVLAINDIVEISRKARRKQWFKSVLGKKRRKIWLNRQGTRKKPQTTEQTARKQVSRSKRDLAYLSVSAHKPYGLSS